MKRRVTGGTSTPVGPGRESEREPDATALFRTLDTMEREADLTAQAGQSRWMIPYADLLTLLLGLFLATMVLPGAPPHPNPPPPGGRGLLSIKESKFSEVKSFSPDVKDKSPLGGLGWGGSSPSPPDTQLEKRLREALQLPGVDIRRQERGIVLSLKESILFAPGEATLSTTARQTLDTLADQLTAILGQAPGPIRIEGHTDATPIATDRYPSNWELSTARATNIVRYLVESRHFPPDRLSAAGYGEFRPLENNSSIEGKRKNRRVDIVILNSGMAREEPHGQTH
jgi:chemotaxis protein MotB